MTHCTMVSALARSTHATPTSGLLPGRISCQDFGVHKNGEAAQAHPVTFVRKP